MSNELTGNELGETLLQSVREMKAGNTEAITKLFVEIMPEASIYSAVPFNVLVNIFSRIIFFVIN